MKNRRKFSTEEKLEILREADQQGIEAALRKYNLARSVYYNWKSKFDRHGLDGLQAKYHKSDPRVKALEKENERLKRVIAKQALELEVKEELLKKTKDL